MAVKNNIIYADDVTPEIRKQVSEKLAAIWDSDDWNEKARIGEVIECEMREDSDFYTAILRVFTAYFHEENWGFDDDMPWKEVADRMLVTMCGWSFLSIAEKAGLTEEED